VKIEQNLQSSNSDTPGGVIAAVARSRFRRFGYTKTSMQEIAEDCGMSVANLYRYYDGKLALGAAVAAAEQAALFAACDRAVAAAPEDLAAKLIALFQALIDGTRRQIKSTPLLFDLGMAVAREQPEHRQRFLRETETRIAAILASSCRGEAMATVSIKAASRLILMASAPFMLPWMLRTQPFGNPRAQVEPLMQCLVLGLTKANAEGAVASDGPSDPP
jgi:AcrR family transcriptional regulator